MSATPFYLVAALTAFIFATVCAAALFGAMYDCGLCSLGYAIGGTIGISLGAPVAVIITGIISHEL